MQKMKEVQQEEAARQKKDGEKAKEKEEKKNVRLMEMKQERLPQRLRLLPKSATAAHFADLEAKKASPFEIIIKVPLQLLQGLFPSVFSGGTQTPNKTIISKKLVARNNVRGLVPMPCRAQCCKNVGNQFPSPLFVKQQVGEITA